MFEFIFHQVDPLASPKKNLELFYMFQRLLDVEKEVLQKVRDTEDEVQQLVKHYTCILSSQWLFSDIKSEYRKLINIGSACTNINTRVDETNIIFDNLELYIRVQYKVYDLNEQTIKILNERASAEAASNLDISVYDTERNEKAKKHRRELVCSHRLLFPSPLISNSELCSSFPLARVQEAKAEEERRRQQETEQDYLGPFVARRGDPDALVITQKLAFDIREDALNVRTFPLSVWAGGRLLNY